MPTLEIETCGLLDSAIGFQKLSLNRIFICSKFHADFFRLIEKKAIKTRVKIHVVCWCRLWQRKKNLIDMQNQNRYIHEFIHLIASNLHHVPSQATLAREKKQHENRFVRCVCKWMRACDSDQHTLNSWSISMFDLCLVEPSVQFKNEIVNANDTHTRNIVVIKCEINARACTDIPKQHVSGLYVWVCEI